MLPRLFFFALASASGSMAMIPLQSAAVERDPYGAIVRGDVNSKKLALIFTGDEFGESTGPILDALKARGRQASFFVTGKFLRQARHSRLRAKGPARAERLPAPLAPGLGPPRPVSHAVRFAMRCARGTSV